MCNKCVINVLYIYISLYKDKVFFKKPLVKDLFLCECTRHKNFFGPKQLVFVVKRVISKRIPLSWPRSPKRWTAVKSRYVFFLFFLNPVSAFGHKAAVQKPWLIYITVKWRATRDDRHSGFPIQIWWRVLCRWYRREANAFNSKGLFAYSCQVTNQKFQKGAVGAWYFQKPFPWWQNNRVSNWWP